MPGRAALHRFDLREGAVDQQHAARLHAQGVELGDQLGWGDRLGGRGNHITAPTRVGIAVGAKRRAFQKSRKPCRAIGEEPSPLPAKIVRRKGEIFVLPAALPL